METTLHQNGLRGVAAAVTFVLSAGVLLVGSSLAFQPLVQLL